MSKSPRKSIVASFGLLSAEIESDEAAERSVAETSPEPSPPPSTRVGAGVISAAHRAIGDIRSERDRLKALVESGGGSIREIDPDLIDPSPFPDRLPDEDSADFERFKRSIESEGQKVPVQVRKHPGEPDRYQIIYGHRRWRAAKSIGRPVRALEVEISDLDLVVAQGIENADRQDLTWIERTLFASRMDDAGIKARNIYAALSIEATELARMRQVYRVLPGDVIEAIGRAPKIGRPRWLELAKLIADKPEILATLRQALALHVAGEPSDRRFQRVLNVVKPSPAAEGPEPRPIALSNGTRLGASLLSSKEVRITAEGAKGNDFLKFVEAHLPELAERFAKQQQ